jgi:glycosyltransferase involved in cell wall biosynthesis
LTSASYHRYLRGLPALFEEIELGAFHDRLAAARSGWQLLRQRLTWAKLRRYLAHVLQDFRACTVVSTGEQRLLSENVARCPPIEVIPNCVTVSDYALGTTAPQPDRLVFAGALSYAANADAVRWFLSEVYPRLKAHRPGVQLTITGDGGGQRLAATDGVLQTGQVADVRPVVGSAWLSIAPILWGGGTRVKIIESMALGTPVVATTKAAEGLEVVDGEHLLLADAAPDFAQSIERLLFDPDLRRRLSANGRRLVEERYSWQVVGPRFLRLVEEVAGETTRREPSRREELA